MQPGRSHVKFVSAVVASWIALLFFSTPSFERLRTQMVGSDKYFYDRQGHLIQVVRTHHSYRQLPWVKLEDVSSHFVHFLISAEDRRFWLHPGLDPIGIARAILKSKQIGSQGGSTITMQLASRLGAFGGSGRSAYPILSKLLQVNQALGLELRWTKEEILSAYINLVPFRGEQIGLPSAAKDLFNKHPSALSEQESAILVAMLRSPNAPLDIIARRSCRMLLTERREYLPATCESMIHARLDGATQRSLANNPVPRMAPHLAQKILKTISGDVSEVRTTIDYDLQRYVSIAIDNRLSQAVEQNAHDAAVIVVDNKTRNVLAYVGGSQKFTTAKYVDGAAALRQPGSTLKPFFYGRAIDRRLITAATIMDDAPTEMTISNGGVYKPRNFDERFRGPVTVRDALAGSLNIPAVRVVTMIGIDDALETLRDFGFKNLRGADFYGPGLALGAADVSLLQLVGAYTALANNGLYKQLSFTHEYKSEEKGLQALSPEASVIIRSILSDNGARSATFGLNSALFTSVETAVKTGTSKDMRDNLCLGFSEAFTVGVWVGNFSGQSMWNLTGVAGAAPIWSDVMHYLHRNKASKFSTDATLALMAKHIRPSFRVTGYDELFLVGTEPEGDVIEEVRERFSTKITYPTHDSIMAIDPDIPAANQKIVFSASAARGNFYWKLNGNTLGPAGEEFSWSPVKGKFTLAIVEKSTGRRLDEVRFIVR